MASKVSIANLALSWLGTNPIISFGDDTVEAKLVSLNYEDALQAVLEDRDWTFAIKRYILTPASESPVFGFSNAFTIPPEVRRLISVGVDRGGGIGFDGITSDVQGTEVQWQKEGNEIVSNEERVFVIAVADNDDASSYPSAFVHALAARLAAELAIPLTHSPKLMASMWQLYAQKLTASSGSDGRQGRREHLEASRLTRARRLGYPLV